MMQVSSATTTSIPTRSQEWQSLPDTSSLPPKVALRDVNVLDVKDVLALLNAPTATSLTANSLPLVLNKTEERGATMSVEAKAALVQTLSNQQQGYQMEKMDRAVAGMASLCGAQLMSNAPAMKGSESGKSTTTTSVSDVSPTARPRTALEGGTDITAPVKTDAFYSNVLGNASVLHAFIAIMRALNQQEAQSNMRAAQWSQNVMSSAHAVGNNLISASEQRRIGALAGGVAGLGITTVATGLTLKSVRNQVKSLNTNMSRSTHVGKGIRDTQKEMKSAQDTMLKKNEPMRSEVGSAVTKKHPDMAYENEKMNNAHQLMGLESAKTRSYAECLNHGSRMTQDSIDRSYDVSASSKTKAAEMSRANQSISGEVDNAHLQTGKRASEGESALRQSLLSILSHNNEAVAAVASRMG